MRVWAVLAMWLLFSSCGSSNKEAESINQAGVFFQSFHEFPYKELIAGSTYQDEITAGSDVFDFEDGKSFFLAYQLPDDKEGYRIRISSYMMGEHIDKASIFFPTVLALDEDYNVIEKYEGDRFHFEKILFRETWGLPFKYEMIISADEKVEGMKFLVVYSTRAQMSQKTSVTSMKVVPVVLPGVVGAIPTGKEEKLIRHSPVGKMRIELDK